MVSKKDQVLTESDVEGTPSVDTDPLYTALSAEFDITHKRPIGGGKILDYITKEQAISRMNAVVGALNWDWDIVRTEQINDEVVVRGIMTVRHNGQTSDKAASGGFKPRSGMSWGDATKAAESDAFKKAAMYFGVALYLAEKSGEGVGELPYSAPQTYTQTNYTQGDIQALPPVRFPTNNSTGTETIGVITAKSVERNSVQVNGEWYKLAGRSVDQYQSLFNTVQKGMAVKIVHPEGKTFINGLEIVTGAVAQEEESLAF